MFEIFSQEKNFLDYAKITIPKTGLFRTKGLSDSLSRHLRADRFEDLNIPLYIAATDLKKGTIVYFNRGRLVDRILASAAIPVLFEPVEIEGDLFVDGGVLDGFPIAPLRQKCRKLVGISLNPVLSESDFNNLFRIASRTFHLSASIEMKKKHAQCDIFIEPEELAGFGMLDVSKAKELFDLGYNIARKKLDEST
jgi:NTE family protein